MFLISRINRLLSLSLVHLVESDSGVISHIKAEVLTQLECEVGILKVLNGVMCHEEHEVGCSVAQLPSHSDVDT